MVRTYKPLSVELGPGLLTTIFDGIQRPLKAIALSSGDVFIPRGVDVPALDRKKDYEFNPRKFKVCNFSTSSSAAHISFCATFCLPTLAGLGFTGLLFGSLGEMGAIQKTFYTYFLNKLHAYQS